MAIGLVIVSHSARLAEGVVELAGQMAQGNVTIAAAGGTADGSLGTSMEKVLEALHQVDSPEGILVLLDLGSAVMTTEMAVEAFATEQPSHRIIISPAPLVEGAVIAAVEASIGNSLDEVAEAAANAHMLPKLSDQHS
jgi:PTS hybrid protein